MTKVTAELTSGTLVTISNGRHTWRADEPPEAKGTDLAPNPYELLLGALSACTCITLSLYCQHKGIPLKSVSAWYDFDRVHADDCDGCEKDGGGQIEQVTGFVRFAGNFDDSQRKRLTQIAQRCPVHKSLAQGMHLVDRAEFST